MGGPPLLKNTIKIQRAVKDWTQEELARRIGVTRKTVNTIENGIYVPSTVLALKMARVFGVPVEAIFQLAEPFPLESDSAA
jgi:putative transcriptional regulator